MLELGTPLCHVKVSLVSTVQPCTCRSTTHRSQCCLVVEVALKPGAVLQQATQLSTYPLE